MGVLTTRPEDLDMSDATVAASPGAGFTRADLTTFCCLYELGLVVTGQRLEPDRAVLACEVLEPDSGVGAAGARARCVTP